MANINIRNQVKTLQGALAVIILIVSMAPAARLPITPHHPAYGLAHEIIWRAQGFMPVPLISWIEIQRHKVRHHL